MPRLIPFLFSSGPIWAPLSGRIYVGLLPRRELRAEKRECVIICHLSVCLGRCLSVALSLARSLPLPAHQFHLPSASLPWILISYQSKATSVSGNTGPKGVSLSFSNASEVRLSRQVLSDKRGAKLGLSTHRLWTQRLFLCPAFIFCKLANAVGISPRDPCEIYSNQISRSGLQCFYLSGGVI